MELNLPIFDHVSGCKNLLIAGMGGGFDLFCGLPIYFQLRQRGMNIHLANYSFSNIENLNKGIRLTDTLVGVTPEIDGHFIYFPELYLTQWFKATYGEEVPIWCFHKTGVRPLIENYQELIDYLKIDGILLIDGGVDSLMRGDEYEVGTIIEDSISLIAVGDLKNVPVRLTGCIGLGAELDLSYEQVFDNMAALTKMGAFLGSCALAQQMEVLSGVRKRCACGTGTAASGRQRDQFVDHFVGARRVRQLSPDRQDVGQPPLDFAADVGLLVF